MHQYKGKIILHTGSMFSGKTSSLWSDLNRFKIARYKTAVFKPILDSRFSKEEIVSHDKHRMNAILISTLDDLVSEVQENQPDVIGIDEVQFINSSADEFLNLLDKFTEQEKTVILAGLDMDYLSRPFEIIKELMPRVDYLYKHHAVCSNCGRDAWVSHRLTDESTRIKIGAAEVYQPLCRACFKKARNK